MLKKQLRSLAFRAVRKHPRRALKLLLFAGRHWKAIAAAVKLARRSSRVARAVKQTAPDVPLGGGVRSAIAGVAGRRGRPGLPAGTAEKLGGGLSANHRWARRRYVRATVITAGAGVVGRMGYAGWKKARGSSAA